MKRFLALAGLVLLVSTAAFADVARPDPPKTPKPTPRAKGIDARLDINLDRTATEARLIIPKSQLKQLRAELEQLDDESGNTTAVSGFSRTQTLVSGMFLSLALVFGGMWFVRSGKAATKTTRTLVVLSLVGAIASAATFAYANIGPPPAARSITGKMFSPDVHQYGYGTGAIRLEVSSGVDSVKLIVPDPKEAGE